MMKRPYRKRRRGFFGSTAFTRRGASMIEVAIAVAIVAISALAAGSFFSHQLSLTRNLTRNSSCKAALESQLGYIREMTAAGSGYEWKGLSSGESGNRLTPPSGLNGDRWVKDEVRLAPVVGADIVSGTGAGKVLNTHLLQKGSVGLLAALYNQVPGIESGVDMTSIAHVTGKDLPADYDTDSLKSFAAKIRISTFDIASGGAPAGSERWARPQGLNPAALATKGIGTLAPGTSASIGYRVRLTGSFIDGTGATKTCESTEDFFYPIDLQGPRLSVVLNVYDAAADSGSIQPFNYTMDPSQIQNRLQCTQTPAVSAQAAIRLEVGFKTSVPTHEKIEPGTIFMCRDVSKQFNPNYCQGAANAAMDGQNYDPANAEWVPCNEATACGMAPASVQFLKSGPGEVKYVLNYDQSTKTSPDGLWGCDIQMDVATIDAAGNFNLLSQKAHPSFASVSAAGGRYFQPPPCYACYKKKPFSFLALALVIGGGILTAGAGLAVAATALAVVGGGIAVGGIIACAAGIGGACKLKGYNFKFNSCNIPAGYTLNSGKYMCRKLTPRYPDWYKPGIRSGTSGAACATAQTFTYPDGHTYTLPLTDSGGVAADAYYDLPNRVSCAVSAVCDNGTWLPEDGQSQIFTCNDLKTVVQMDSHFSNPQRLCVLEVPQGAPSQLLTSGYYTRFTDRCSSLPDGIDRPCYHHYPYRNSRCSGPSCYENHGGICNLQHLSFGRLCDEYPVDALDQSVINTSNVYSYFENYNPATDGGLTACETSAP
jgi:hypothetical protein